MRRLTCMFVALLLAFSAFALVGCSAEEEPAETGETSSESTPAEDTTTPVTATDESALPKEGSAPVDYASLAAAPARSAEAFLKVMLDYNYGHDAEGQLDGATAEYSMEYNTRVVTIVVNGEQLFSAKHNLLGDIEAWEFLDMTMPGSENAGIEIGAPAASVKAAQDVATTMAEQALLPQERLDVLIAQPAQASQTTNGHWVRSLDVDDTSLDYWWLWFGADGRVERAELGFGGN